MDGAYQTSQFFTHQLKFFGLLSFGDLVSDTYTGPANWMVSSLRGCFISVFAKLDFHQVSLNSGEWKFESKLMEN
jgi:hypothetical protein